MSSSIPFFILEMLFECQSRFFFFSSLCLSKINRSYPRGMGMGRRKAGVIVERRNKMDRELVERQVPREG